MSHLYRTLFLTLCTLTACQGSLNVPKIPSFTTPRFLPSGSLTKIVETPSTAAPMTWYEKTFGSITMPSFQDVLTGGWTVVAKTYSGTVYAIDTLVTEKALGYQVEHMSVAPSTAILAGAGAYLGAKTAYGAAYWLYTGRQLNKPEKLKYFYLTLPNYEISKLTSYHGKEADLFGIMLKNQELVAPWYGHLSDSDIAPLTQSQKWVQAVDHWSILSQRLQPADLSQTNKQAPFIETWGPLYKKQSKHGAPVTDDKDINNFFQHLIYRILHTASVPSIYNIANAFDQNGTLQSNKLSEIQTALRLPDKLQTFINYAIYQLAGEIHQLIDHSTASPIERSRIKAYAKKMIDAYQTWLPAALNYIRNEQTSSLFSLPTKGSLLGSDSINKAHPLYISTEALKKNITLLLDDLNTIMQDQPARSSAPVSRSLISRIFASTTQTEPDPVAVVPFEKELSTTQQLGTS
jgi:hypothetical protein